MKKKAAIILAGGRGQRFQTKENDWKDKALAQLEGKPLLVHVVQKIGDVVDETIVVVNENNTRVSNYHSVLASYNLKADVVTDLKIKNLHGPLIAILTGLKTASADVCITVPTDMPLLSSDVAEYMFSQLEKSFVEVPIWPNGKLETLLLVLDRETSLEIAHTLCQMERSHPDDIIRASQNALLISPLGKIKTLDPELKSFVNINSQEDLSLLQPRLAQGSTVESLRLNLGELPKEEIALLLKASAKRDLGNFAEAAEMFGECAIDLERETKFFWAAMAREFEAKSLRSNEKAQVDCVNNAFLHAANDYALEAKVYDEKCSGWLAERARSDQTWCQNQIKNVD